MQEPNIGSQAAPAMHPSHGSHPSPVHSLPKFGIPWNHWPFCYLWSFGQGKKNYKKSDRMWRDGDRKRGGEDPKSVNLKRSLSEDCFHIVSLCPTVRCCAVSFAVFQESGHLVDALIHFDPYLPIPKCKRLLGSIPWVNGGRYRRSSLLAPLSKEANQQLGDNLHLCQVMTNQATRSKNLHKTGETAMALGNSSNRARRLNSCHSSPSHPLVDMTRNCHAHFLKRKYTSPVQTFLTRQCFWTEEDDHRNWGTVKLVQSCTRVAEFAGRRLDFWNKVSARCFN